jgi:hypothetical protein
MERFDVELSLKVGFLTSTHATITPTSLLEIFAICYIFVLNLYLTIDHTKNISEFLEMSNES